MIRFIFLKKNHMPQLYKTEEIYTTKARVCSTV